MTCEHKSQTQGDVTYGWKVLSSQLALGSKFAIDPSNVLASFPVLPLFSLILAMIYPDEELQKL